MTRADRADLFRGRGAVTPPSMRYGLRKWRLLPVEGAGERPRHWTDRKFTLLAWAVVGYFVARLVL